MKQMRYFICVLFAIAFGAQTQAQEIIDGEAFYIYRNDGGFNGFFFDEVLDMSYSKFDLDSIEHDDYVVQDVVTADSIYRIPLCAIDSVGFVQPEIIISDKVKFNEYGVIETPYDYAIGTLHDSEDPYIVYWSLVKKYNATPQKLEITVDESQIPKVGEIIYQPYWRKPYQGCKDPNLTGDFVAIVKEVCELDGDMDINGKKLEKEFGRKIICEPITNIGDIYEQYICVERLGADEDGIPIRQIAGRNKIKRKIEGSKELTICDIAMPVGAFGLPVSKCHTSLRVSGGLKVTARVTYNLSRRNCFLEFEFNEKGELGLELELKGEIYEKKKGGISATVSFPVPSFLPVMTLKTGPNLFVNAQADVTLKASTPKFKFDRTQTVKYSGISYSGRNVDKAETPKTEEPDDWGLELALNGSVHAGLNYETSYGIASWAERFIKGRVELDVNMGPKIAGSFAFDLTKKDLHSVLKNTNVSFSPFAATIEAKVVTGFGKESKEYKFLDGEIDVLKYNLHLLPDFKKVEYEVVHSAEGGFSLISAVNRPFHDTPYYGLGVALMTKADSLITFCNGPEYINPYYSFMNPYAERRYAVRVLKGDYKLVPSIYVPAVGHVYAWGAAADVHVDLIPLYVDKLNDTVVLQGLQKGDVISVRRLESEGVIKLVPDYAESICIECGLYSTPEWHEKSEHERMYYRRMSYMIKKEGYSDKPETFHFTVTSLDGTVRTAEITIKQ